jgi:outer membrane phospholipase A
MSPTSFRVIKFQFNFRKALYRELTKNDSKLTIISALANVFQIDHMARTARLIRLKNTKLGSIILFSGRKVINHPHY